MLQFVKTAAALFGTILGFWLGGSVAQLLGMNTKFVFLMFAFLGATTFSILYVLVFYRLMFTKYQTGAFAPKQLLLAALLVVGSMAALLLTLPNMSN